MFAFVYLNTTVIVVSKDINFKNAIVYQWSIGNIMQYVLFYIIKYILYVIVFRLVVLQMFIAFGSILGSIISPALYNKSFTIAFTLSSICTIAGLLYTSIFLKESVVIKEVFIFK